ncbi:tetratricopeptide repeat protein [Chitiniphilus purpureus]|uniref:Tetratricopeptide repeat protein n=1 Tax=Chitiniphilus purpureus TaxID=2981137 RepID=A0ABY6DKN8_9NEIS|nr:tetratricopeptide repeat protein [Chitiniphilus sp. CD1]UXY14939.1 tetratricopeptide repeat protein [Chitiniphilus sp. CD1]
MKDVPDISSDLQLAAAKGREIIAALQRLVGEVEQAQSDAARLVAAGKIREVAQTFQLAQKHYQAALQHDPGSLEAKARLAILYTKQRRRPTALKTALEVAQQNAKFKFSDITGRPRSVQTVLGDAHRESGNAEDAKTAYAAALKLQSGDDYAAFRLAQLHLGSGDIAAAQNLAKKMGEHPEFAELHAALRLVKAGSGPGLRGTIADLASKFAAAV